jgi:hypothetical protein
VRLAAERWTFRLKSPVEDLFRTLYELDEVLSSADILAAGGVVDSSVVRALRHRHAELCDQLASHASDITEMLGHGKSTGHGAHCSCRPRRAHRRRGVPYRRGKSA